MFASIRSRLVLIAALVIASVYFLFPRNVTIRERGPSGVMRDTVVTRVPLKRGLDLQGGMHLALELDQSKQVSADPKKDLDLALTVLRKRIDEFGVEEPLVQKVGDNRIVVELAGITDPARAKAIVQRSAFLEFKITDKSGALEKAIPAMDRTLRSLGIKGAPEPTKPSAVQQLLGGDSVRPSADSARRPATGKKTAKTKGNDSAAKRRSDSAAADTTAVPGGVLAGLIQAGSGGVPGEYMVPETAYPRVDSLLSIPAVRRQLPRGLTFRWSAAETSVGVQPVRFLYVLEDKSIVTGSNLVDAQAQLDPLTNGAIVTFELDRSGGRKFGDETGKHVGDFMAILLDGKVQGRPPVIQSRIGRNGQITLGGKSLQEAQDLALTLKAGALPIPLKIVEERQVGASLGSDSIHDGIKAAGGGPRPSSLSCLAFYRRRGGRAGLRPPPSFCFRGGGPR